MPRHRGDQRPSGPGPVTSKGRWSWDFGFCRGPRVRAHDRR
ncbi:hypothetical protein NSERUTF1_4172 [Nocardia seriolae]|nr:hypothetical protein NSERUTF1_4172 [Nocardia seriolae]